MSTLLNRLQQTVGDTYRVERELGGGGMSQVFLAEERRLGRRVVIKVLPPEMAAGVNVARFEREIQLAASLQHPHVVQLFTAGAQGDLLYYVMPFIEGESLRARLAREGQLPIPEVLRILKDVVDALAFAHAHNVVHRDIKPDNVLLAGKHALVTDFGVAKAVSESTGSSLTSMGVALGTPMYMAPEQAAADPHVDHRADIYSVGIMAYEMLCGRPPFLSATAQGLLAAHVTESPDPVTRHRATVPPALSEVVMRCLQKLPADRWQRAEELLANIEAMLTPTGGVTPTDTVPVRAVDLEAARRAHPARVAALFGVASVAVLGLVYSVVQMAGLPDWVFLGATGLMAAGLPIMLATGVFERRRALARTTGRQVVTPQTGVTRLLTWRGSLLGGGLAFSALTAVAVAYMAMRALGIGPVGTLVAAGVMGERDPLIVAEFQNRTGDSTLGPSVTEALRIDLAQSPKVRLLDGAAVAAALQRMGRDRATPVTEAVAKDLAEREGAKAFVSGDVSPLGGGFVVSARVISTGSGEALVALRETAEDARAIVGAIDRLSKKLRERIGESLRTIRSNQPLEQVTTSSMEALRKYTQAIRAFNQAEYDRAIPLLEEAVALDTGFAMAYRKLAVAFNNSFGSRTKAAGAATQAFQHRDRLPSHERYLATAYYYSTAQIDIDKTIETYRSMLESYPDDPTALNNLSVTLFRRHEWEETERLLRRGLAVTNTMLVMHTNATWSQINQAKYAAADSTITRFAAVMPGNPSVLRMRGFLASAQRQWSIATARFDSLARVATGAGMKQEAFQRLAQLSMVRGRLAEAERHMQQALAIADQRAQPQDHLTISADLAFTDIAYRGDAAGALRRMKNALQRHPWNSMPPSDRPYTTVAAVYARAGQPGEARRLLAEWERVTDPGLRAGDLSHYFVTAEIAMAERRPMQAIPDYRRWYSDEICSSCSLFEQGRAFEAAGQADSALAMYERAVNIPDGLRIQYEAAWLGPAYQQIGQLYEAKSDRARAAENYSKLLDLWKDADADLQPAVRETRARLARLTQEP